MVKVKPAMYYLMNLCLILLPDFCMTLCQILLQIFKDLSLHCKVFRSKFLVIFKIVSKVFDTILRFFYFSEVCRRIGQTSVHWRTGKPAVCTLAQQYQQDLHWNINGLNTILPLFLLHKGKVAGFCLNKKKEGQNKTKDTFGLQFALRLHQVKTGFPL